MKRFIKANGLKHGDQINKSDINLLASIAKFRDAEFAVKRQNSKIRHQPEQGYTLNE